MTAEIVKIAGTMTARASETAGRMMTAGEAEKVWKRQKC